MGHMLHFAYGEDLRHAEFLRVCPQADWFGPARMEDHELVFEQGGYANVKAFLGGVVWGSLWLVPSDSLAAFDEAAKPGFLRTTRRIVSPAGPRTEATVYVSDSAENKSPTPEAIAALVSGAKESKLPPAYIKQLQANV